MNKNFNFFRPYNKRNRQVTNIRLVFIIFFLTTMGFALLLVLFDFLHLKTLQNELTIIDNEIGIYSDYDTVKRYEEVLVKYKNLEKYTEIIIDIDKAIKDIDVINIELFQQLEKC